MRWSTTKGKKELWRSTGDKTSLIDEKEFTVVHETFLKFLVPVETQFSQSVSSIFFICFCYQCDLGLIYVYYTILFTSLVNRWNESDSNLAKAWRSWKNTSLAEKWCICIIQDLGRAVWCEVPRGITSSPHLISGKNLCFRTYEVHKALTSAGDIIIILHSRVVPLQFTRWYESFAQ